MMCLVYVFIIWLGTFGGYNVLYISKLSLIKVSGR